MTLLFRAWFYFCSGLHFSFPLFIATTPTVAPPLALSDCPPMSLSGLQHAPFLPPLSSSVAPPYALLSAGARSLRPTIGQPPATTQNASLRDGVDDECGASTQTRGRRAASLAHVAALPTHPPPLDPTPLVTNFNRWFRCRITLGLARPRAGSSLGLLSTPPRRWRSGRRRWSTESRNAACSSPVLTRASPITTATSCSTLQKPARFGRFCGHRCSRGVSD